MEAVFEERRRQAEREGFGPSHDDAHVDGCLLAAARLYAGAGAGLYAGAGAGPGGPEGRPVVPPDWPWEASWWKPRDRWSNLVRAGALCAAEAQRLRRAGSDAAPARRELAAVLALMGGLPDPASRAAA